MKRVLLIIFLIVAIAQIYVPAEMIYRREAVLKNGKEWKFITQPLDPTDPFRGSYIRLYFENARFDSKGREIWSSGEQAYVHLRDSAGFARIAGLSKERPDDTSDFLKAEIGYADYFGPSKATIFINYPFDRFYMGEFKARPAEAAYFESLADSSKTTYAVVSVLNGDAVLKHVRVGNRSLEEIAAEALKRQ